MFQFTSTAGLRFSSVLLFSMIVGFLFTSCDSFRGEIRKADAGGAVTGAIGAAASGFGEATFGAGIVMGALVGNSAASTGKAAEIGYEKWVE